MRKIGSVRRGGCHSTCRLAVACGSGFEAHGGRGRQRRSDARFPKGTRRVLSNAPMIPCLSLMCSCVLSMAAPHMLPWGCYGSAICYRGDFRPHSFTNRKGCQSAYPGSSRWRRRASPEVRISTFAFLQRKGHNIVTPGLIYPNLNWLEHFSTWKSLGASNSNFLFWNPPLPFLGVFVYTWNGWRNPFVEAQLSHRRCWKDGSSCGAAGLGDLSWSAGFPGTTWDG